MSIDNIKKHKAEPVARSGIELAITQEDIFGFIQSYPHKVSWNWYAKDLENHPQTCFGE